MFFIRTHQPNNEPSAHSYRNQRVALLTQHGKEGVIAPVLAELLGCRVEKVDGFDTDLLGTFTRDIAREGTQLDAARKKARIGMELSGLSSGIASEGAFGPDPSIFMLPGNRELLIWIDDRLGIEVVATSSGKTNLSHCLAESWEEAEDFARSAGFPEHHLVVRPVDENHPELCKGLADWAGLKDAVTWALDLAPNRHAFIETDMRAFANPTRLENIRLAAEDLARRRDFLWPDWCVDSPARTAVRQPARRRRTFTAAFAVSIRCWWSGSGNTPRPILRLLQSLTYELVPNLQIGNPEGEALASRLQEAGALRQGSGQATKTEFPSLSLGTSECVRSNLYPLI